MQQTALPLRDLHLPEAVGWWPLAPGWWALIVLAAVGLVWLLLKYRQKRRLSAARRYALKQLKHYHDEYMKHHNAVLLGSQLSELLRRTMLAYTPREKVAGLTGEDWLAFLDRGLERPQFRDGDGRPLVEWPYRGPGFQPDESDVAALLDAVRLRLSTPVAGDA